MARHAKKPQEESEYKEAARIFRVRLSDLLSDCEMTTAEASTKLEFTQSYLSTMFASERIPSGWALIKMSREFDVSVDYLLGIKDTCF